MADPVRRRSRSQRLARLALGLAILAVAAALIASIGSGQGLWHFRHGFLVLRYALFAAAGAFLLALLALFTGRKSSGRSGGKAALGALLISGLFLGYLGSLVHKARSVPAIHDVATNLADMPRFYRLPVREDNLANIPDNGDPRLAALPPAERWQALHRSAYGDLKTVRVPGNVAETVARASRLAEQNGWEVVTSDPTRGIMEAVDTSLFFRFKDNVVLRARPAPGGGTEVDMRSISQVGGSDVGMNAQRIRGFLRDITA